MTQSETGHFDRERFARWQKICLDQLGYALNLILTLTIAALGFCFSLLKDSNFTPGNAAKRVMILSIVLLGVSALSGLACVLNRLLDFRGTAQRARANPDAPDLGYLKGLGKRTWTLLYIQLATFALGTIALGTTLLLTYGGKLA